MAMEKCPECGASVKADNLRKHLRNVHPGVDADARLTTEQKELARKAQRAAVGPLRRSPIFIGGILVLIVAGAVVGMPYLINLTNGGFNIVTTCGAEGTVEHYHAFLVIDYNGVREWLPWDQSQSADIGYINSPTYTNPAYYCPSGESHVIHTHDGSGVLHVELPQTITGVPTLGEFFQIWGQPLGSGAVWSYPGTVTATLYNSDTGGYQDYSSNPGGIPLYPSPQGPTANPYSIPQYLFGDGSHGTGESSGLYTGEIIWLNVTA